MSERELPPEEHQPEDVPDGRCDSGGLLPDDRAAERPQTEPGHPERREAERDRDDQDEADDRRERVEDRQPQAAEDEPDDVEDQSHSGGRRRCRGRIPGDRILERLRVVGAEVVADEPAAMSVERTDHRVDVVRRGHHDHRRRSLRNLAAHLVEERATQVRGAALLGDAAREPTADQAHGEAGRTEEQSDGATGNGALGRPGADELLLVVGVHVAAGERSPNHDPVAPMVLDERDLLRPGHATNGGRRARVSPLGSLGVLEHHQREIEAARFHRRRR